MKTINLKIAERLQLVAFLNSFQGKSFETLTEVWKLIEKVKVTEEERKELNYRQEGMVILWDEAKDTGKDFEITSDEEKEIVEEFETRSKEKKLGSDVYNLAQVYIKLKK